MNYIHYSIICWISGMISHKSFNIHVQRIEAIERIKQVKRNIWYRILDGISNMLFDIETIRPKRDSTNVRYLCIHESCYVAVVQ